jgi:hypothetical protein
MAIDDGPRGTADGGGHRPPLQLTGMDDDLLRDVEQRVSEFEELHEPDVLRKGPGVGATDPAPRLRHRDRRQRGDRGLARHRADEGVSGMALREHVIRQEVHANLVPLRGRERLYGGWDFLAVQICFGIAA